MLMEPASQKVALHAKGRSISRQEGGIARHSRISLDQRARDGLD